MVEHQYIRNFPTGIKALILLSVLLAAGSAGSAVPAVRGQGTLGARALALGQATAAMAGDNWAVFHNPALLKTEQHAVSFYAMRFAGLAELTDMAAAATFGLPGSPGGVVGAGLHRYGFDLFSETRFRIGYRNSLDRFSYGALVNYSHVSLGGGYGSAGAAGIDLGVAAEPGGGLVIGARAVNINRPAYGDTDEELPRELAIGVTYRMSGSAVVLADLVKDVRFPLSLRCGFELLLFPDLYARTGITLEPGTWSLGFGYSPESFSVGIAVQNHDVLGLNPGLDFSVSL
ncbi:MAG: hypothetical protein WD317_09250 [Balneolaceae bacterium]